MDNNYYLVNKLRLVKDFNPAIVSARTFFASHYSPGVSEDMVHQARQEFEHLLFHLPYIGGEQNPLTRNLVHSAWILALYRVLESYGKSLEEVGALCYEIADDTLAQYPKLLSRLRGLLSFNPLALSVLQQRAAESQRRRYPGDWVYTYVKGDGSSFDYGVDYTECGICKFYHAQGADELTQYVCRLDFPISQAMGTGLRREHMLAAGHSCCDFRYQSGRSVTRAWPPAC